MYKCHVNINKGSVFSTSTFQTPCSENTSVVASRRGPGGWWARHSRDSTLHRGSGDSKIMHRSDQLASQKQSKSPPTSHSTTRHSHPSRAEKTLKKDTTINFFPISCRSPSEQSVINERNYWTSARGKHLPYTIQLYTLYQQNPPKKWSYFRIIMSCLLVLTYFLV